LCTIEIDSNGKNVTSTVRIAGEHAVSVSSCATLSRKHAWRSLCTTASRCPRQLLLQGGMSSTRRAWIFERSIATDDDAFVHHICEWRATLLIEERHEWTQA
jgi:hypothetical protein